VEWQAGDFAAGDVMIFHSHTVHKALPNLTRDQLRLSTDNRYTRVGDEVAEVSRKSHYEL
jgi:ectoine hydroxylase-related dioxygenase (phytanoyl-CoA dioxygenase family)